MGKCIGQIGYESYRNFTGGLSLATGQPIPEWHELSEKIQEAWRAAARGIGEELSQRIKNICGL